MKKFILIIVALIIVVLLGGIIWVKYIPASNIPFLLPDTGVGQVLCKYPVMVQGKSMEPDLLEGKRVTFSKCFVRESLEVETFVVFRERNYTRIGKVIMIHTEEDEIVYKVIQTAHPDEVYEVKPDDIVAVKSET